MKIGTGRKFWKIKEKMAKTTRLVNTKALHANATPTASFMVLTYLLQPSIATNTLRIFCFQIISACSLCYAF
jgi:hypothetical protein